MVTRLDSRQFDRCNCESPAAFLLHLLLQGLSWGDAGCIQYPGAAESFRFEARRRSMTDFIERVKDVFVRAYRRVRLGRPEQVRQHWRSHPRQLTFPFI